MNNADEGRSPEPLAPLRDYERQYSNAVALKASAEDVFTFADDFAELSSHMGTSSLMMMGSSMHTSFDEGRGQVVGSRVRMTGRILELTSSSMRWFGYASRHIGKSGKPSGTRAFWSSATIDLDSISLQRANPPTCVFSLATTCPHPLG
jgi:hypothetical protein